MKSIFDECKKSARETVKAKISKGFVEDSFKKISSGATFSIKFPFKEVPMFPFDLQLFLLLK